MTEHVVEGDPPAVCRWWADNLILVGGLIQGPEDWAHLRYDLGIGAVLNLQIEPSADNVVVRDVPYVNAGTPDDGAPKPLEFWTTCIAFAFAVLRDKHRRLYVHCAAGASRAPSVTYAILRTSMRLHPKDALARVRRPRRPDWGNHPIQANYLRSCEDSLAVVREMVAPW